MPTLEIMQVSLVTSGPSRTPAKQYLQPESPSRAGDVEASSVVDGELPVTWVVDIMVRGPQPAVFHVQALGASSHVHAHVTTNAVCVDRVGARCGRAIGDREAGTSEAADTCVDIPHSGGYA